MESDDIAIAGLTQNRNLIAIAIACTLGGLNGRYVHDVAIVTNGIVVDVVADHINYAVIADCNVPEGSVLDAGMAGKVLRDFDSPVKSTNSYFAIEVGALDKLREKAFLCNFNVVPVLSPASVRLEDRNFFGSKIPIGYPRQTSPKGRLLIT